VWLALALIGLAVGLWLVFDNFARDVFFDARCRVAHFSPLTTFDVVIPPELTSVSWGCRALKGRGICSYTLSPRGPANIHFCRRQSRCQCTSPAMPAMVVIGTPAQACIRDQPVPNYCATISFGLLFLQKPFGRLKGAASSHQSLAFFVFKEAATCPPGPPV